MKPDVTLASIEDARRRLGTLARETPLLFSSELSRLTGNQLYVKAENLQITGSFKIRGAGNKIIGLAPDEAARGVVAASAGNHAQGVALAARRQGIRATVFMPRGAAIRKLVATRELGADTMLVGADYDEAYQEAVRFAGETGGTFVHAFDDPQVISGQGTVGLELVEQLPDVDAVLVPVGGGGLISGIGVAVKERFPGVRLIGIQAEGAAAPYRSRRTIADGLAVKQPGDAARSLMEHYVDDLVTVGESDIARAVLAMLERVRLVVEGAGSVGLAALLADRCQFAASDRVVVVASGGNIDVDLLARIIEKGLAEEGRCVRFATHLPDRPGELHRLLDVVAEREANVVSVYHDRLRPDVVIGETRVELTLEARDRRHVGEILAALEDLGYKRED